MAASIIIMSLVFKALLGEVLKHSSKSTKSTKSIIQSSVGLIFRLNPYKSTSPQQIIQSNTELQTIELLFTQRAGYQKDRNALNVVFPGGQADKGEDDLMACKRQLMEEIGLDVEKECSYVGRLPENFYYMKKRGKKVFITCHIWLMGCSDWMPKLSQDELRDYKWVLFQQLIDSNNYVKSNVIRIAYIDRMGLGKTITDNVNKNLISLKMPELELGMDRNLWGLTLWIWSYCMQMATINLQLTVSKQNNEAKLNLKKLTQFCKGMDIQFKDYYFLKYPILLGANYWHYYNRVKSFTYYPNINNKVGTAIKMSILLLLICLLWNIW